jgi:hypothetical protein
LDKDKPPRSAVTTPAAPAPYGIGGSGDSRCWSSALGRRPGCVRCCVWLQLVQGANERAAASAGRGQRRPLRRPDRRPRRRAARPARAAAAPHGVAALISEIQARLEPSPASSPACCLCRPGGRSFRRLRPKLDQNAAVPITFAALAVIRAPRLSRSWGRKASSWMASAAGFYAAVPVTIDAAAWRACCSLPCPPTICWRRCAAFPPPRGRCRPSAALRGARAGDPAAVG